MPVSSRNTNAVLLRLFSFDGVDVKSVKKSVYSTVHRRFREVVCFGVLGMTHFSELVGRGSKPGAQTVDVSSGADDEGGARVDDGLAAAGAGHRLTGDFHAARESRAGLAQVKHAFPR